MIINGRKNTFCPYSMLCLSSAIAEFHVTSNLYFLSRKKHITMDMYFAGRETQITRNMCFPASGTHITAVTVFHGKAR